MIEIPPDNPERSSLQRHRSNSRLEDDRSRAQGLTARRVHWQVKEEDVYAYRTRWDDPGEALVYPIERIAEVGRVVQRQESADIHSKNNISSPTTDRQHPIPSLRWVSLVDHRYGKEQGRL